MIQKTHSRLCILKRPVALLLLVLLISSCFPTSSITNPVIIEPHKRAQHDLNEPMVEYPTDIGIFPSPDEVKYGKFYTDISLTFVNPEEDQIEYYYKKFEEQLKLYHEYTDSLLVMKWDKWYYTVRDTTEPYLNQFTSYAPDAGAYAEEVGGEDADNELSIIVMASSPYEQYIINGFVKNISQYDILQNVLCTNGYADFNYFYTQYDYNYVYLSYNGLTTSPNTLAHELAHFFMVPHDTESDSNIMWPYAIRSKQQSFRQGQLDTMWNALPFRECVVKVMD